MKKIILSIVMGSLLSIGSAQAALISVVDGLGMFGTFSADSNVDVTDIEVTNGVLGFGAPAPLTPVGPSAGFTTEDGKTTNPADSDGAAFVHDFFFTNAPSDSINITATSELQLTGDIDPFFIAVLVSDPANGILEEIVPITPFFSFLRLDFAVAKGADYLIQLTGLAEAQANYNFQMAVVPVPAAVWLFGTAMLGLFGMRRKQKLQAAAA